MWYISVNDIGFWMCRSGECKLISFLVSYVTSVSFDPLEGSGSRALAKVVCC